MESLGASESLAELDLTLEEMEKYDNIAINFDLKNKKIGVHSTAADKKGDSLYEWNVDTTTGDVTEVKRNEETASSVTT